MSRIYDLEKLIKEKVPDFKIKFKDESYFMKVIGKILFFNKTFMTGYTTTIGKTVYFPSKEKFLAYPDRYLYTLAHEYVHISDYVNNPIKFTLGYLFPQLLSLLSLLSVFAFINPLFLLFLFSLIFLAPIPAPFRAKSEIRGYGMSIKIRIWDGLWLKDEIKPIIKTRFAKAFTTSAYYFMCPFKKLVEKKLFEYVDNDKLEDPAFFDIYKFITQNENI